MSAVDGIDIGVTLDRIAAARPSFDEDHITERHLAWAIEALERSGLYPDRSYLRTVLGRRLPRDTPSLLTTIYRRRSLATSKPAPTDPDFLEVYEAMCRHARRRVEHEFDNVRADLIRRTEDLDETRGVVEEQRRMAQEKSRLADALRETVAHELEDGRRERSDLQMQLDAAKSELAQSEHALADAIHTLARKDENLASATATLAALQSSNSDLSSRLSAAEATKKLAAEAATRLKSELDQTRQALTSVLVTFSSEQERSQQLQRQLVEALKDKERLSNTLAQATTRLGRERLLVLNGRERARTLQHHLDLAHRASKGSVKAIQVLQAERDELAAAVKTLRTERDAARTGYRSTRALLLRTQRLQGVK